MAAKLLTRIREITLIRSLGLVIIVGAILMFISGQFGAYNDSQIATGLYYFAALAGLTMLIGLSGQVSLGHGAFLAVGAYTTVLLVGHGWALVPAIVVATTVSVLLGIPVGIAASRLRGPYLAGATLAFAVGLPALADRYPTTFGGENGLTINPPIPPSSLGADFSLERWQLYIAGAGALIVLWVLYNLIHGGASRQLKAVRDDEVAASLCGISVTSRQVFAFTVSAGCAGLAGGMYAVVLNLVTPSAFPLTLSLSLLTGVVVGGLGSIVGAAWGAALLVLLPTWTSDLGNSLNLSTNVQGNLPFAVYGAVLIVAMLVWPSGIQGGVRALTTTITKRRRG